MDPNQPPSIRTTGTCTRLQLATPPSPTPAGAAIATAPMATPPMVAPVPFTPWMTTVARSGRATTPIAATQAPIPSPQPFTSANTYQGLCLNDASSDDKMSDRSEVLLSQHTPHDTNTGISSGNDKATTVNGDTEPSSLS